MLYREGSLRPGQHVSLMGADGPGKAEVAVEELRRARLFCDDWEQASHGGELAAAVEAGAVARDDVTELGAVLAGAAEGRRSADEVTLFDSTGLAIQDLAIAKAAYAKADGLDLQTHRALGERGTSASAIRLPRHARDTSSMSVAAGYILQLVAVLASTLDDHERLARRWRPARTCRGTTSTGSLPAVAGEPPLAFRRRILLERAAYRLLRATHDHRRRDRVLATRPTKRSPVRSAVRTAERRPSGAAPARSQIDAPSRVHFHPPGGLRDPGSTKG